MALTTYTELKTSIADWLNRTDLTAAIPDFITLAESKFRTELRFYASFSALSGSVASNDVLVKAPDLYLFGSLLAAAPYLEHDERVPVWQGLYDTAVARLNARRDWETAAAASSPTTYATLQTAIGLWLNRSDLSLQAPMFIMLAEAEMKRRIRRSTNTTTIYISAANMDGPTDMASPVSLHLDSGTPSSDFPLKLGTPEMLAEVRARANDVAGRPTHWAFWDSQLQFAPTPDQSYDGILVYNVQLTALSTGNTTNTILTEAPDAYLFGSLLAAAPYLEHDERMPVWQAKFDAAIEQLNQVRVDESYGAGLKDLRLPRVFG